MAEQLSECLVTLIQGVVWHHNLAKYLFLLSNKTKRVKDELWIAAAIPINKHMRANEFIIEAAIGTLRIGDITIIVDDHAIEQVYMREINPKEVDAVLRKLPAIKNELGAMETNSKIWIKDPKTNISIGLRRISSDQLRFQFKTAVQNRTYQSDTEEIVLPEQLEELTFMNMSQCTKDCSGHEAGYAWSKARGGVSAASWSPSFNKGAEIASQGY